MKTIQGPKLTFLGRHQLATKIFFSVAKWKKLFLYSKTQAKISGCHRLASKICAIDVIRSETSAEIIF